VNEIYFFPNFVFLKLGFGIIIRIILCLAGS
jgi:hypothetical protein